jgi:hypothetical protein
MQKNFKVSRALLIPVGAFFLVWVGYQILTGRLIGRGTIATVHEHPLLFLIVIALEMAVGTAILFFGICSVFNLFPKFIRKIAAFAEKFRRF